MRTARATVRWLFLFLALWLVMAGVFVAGLGSAWLTGQADPWSWGLSALVGLVAAGLVLRRMALWAGSGAAAMVLIFCAVAAARWPDPAAMAGLIALALLATSGGWLVRDRCWFAGVLLTVSAVLLSWRGPAQPILSQSDRPRLAIISALPLFWDEAGHGLAGPVDAPIVTLLRTRFDLRPIDDPAALSATGARLLLLAQPRARCGPQRWSRSTGGCAMAARR